MARLSKNEEGFIKVRYVLLVLVLAAAGYAAYVFYHSNSKTQVSYIKLSSNDKPASLDPYAGWLTYNSPNRKVSFKYPGGWIATDGRVSGLVAYVTSGAIVASTAGVAGGSGADASEIVLRVQVAAYSGNNFCADIACQVVAAAPLSGAQLGNDELAVINETFQNRVTTVYAVTSNSVKVGATAVAMANVGNGLSVSGQPQNSSPSTASSLGVAVSNAAAFQSSSDFKNLVLLINSLKFN